MALSPDFILADRHESLYVLFVVAVGASLALFLTFSEYLLLSNTSSITVSICGIIKVCVYHYTNYSSCDFYHQAKTNISITAKLLAISYTYEF